MTTNTIKTQLVQLILKNAKTPRGFLTEDAGDRLKYARVLAGQMVEDGVLTKIRFKGSHSVNYFTGPRAAADFEKWSPSKPAKHKKPLVKATQKLAPLALGLKAEIIKPASVKHTYHPFVDLRAVVVPFVKIGTPGWSKSIGAGA